MSLIDIQQIRKQSHYFQNWFK